VDALQSLTEINLDDLVSAFGLRDRPRLERATRGLLRGAAHKFARQIVDFDSAIGARGLTYAARATQAHYVRDVRVFGAERIPSGPILALANHPGMTDTLALFCALGRDDLKVIALDRPFLLCLAHLSERLCFVTDQPSERVALVRRVSAHLRSGGAVLTFPAGHTEPDPDLHAGAVASLERWTESAGVFLRLAPETAVVPLCVRGVYWRRTANHPLTRLRQTFDDRQLLASILQLLAHMIWNVRPVTVHIQVGQPFTARELGSFETGAIQKELLHQMRDMLQAPACAGGVSAL
jgi:1-acyl-sn-glycerol-3-phosphate acyltransferase